MEHGNFVDEATAQLTVENCIYLMLTLITSNQMESLRWKGYLSPASPVKNTEVYKAGLDALSSGRDNVLRQRSF